MRNGAEIGDLPPDNSSGNDEFFCQLDAKQIWYNQRVWHIRVDSITRENNEWWIQLRVLGPIVFDVVVHAGSCAAAPDVVRMLRWWLADSTQGVPARCALAPREIEIHSYTFTQTETDPKTQTIRGGMCSNLLIPKAADSARRRSDP